jgi:hypothetical protein
MFGKDLRMRSLLLLLVVLSLLTACGTTNPPTQTVSQASAAAQASSSNQPTPEPSAVAETPIAPVSVTPAPLASPAITPTTGAIPPPTLTPAVAANENVGTAHQLIADQAQTVVETLQQRDLQKLAGLVHPQKGLRFSPYSGVSEQQLVFTAEQVAAMATDTTTYTWGAYDGTGFPIELTFVDYFNRFVYSHDFAQAERVGYNEAVGKGASYDNGRRFYGPNAIIVEYHFPGFDPIYEGMDWVSLQVVFEEVDQQWYVSGLIHDQWTI